MNFEFHSGRIVFGWSAVEKLAALAEKVGKRPLLVTGSHPERVSPFVPFAHKVFPVEGEPTLQVVREGVTAARDDCDYIIGFGGGSAIDAAKAIAVLATNSGEPLDYLEVIGKGQSFEVPPLPIVAVPTTAGTGAEVTRNAVLGSPEHGLKASLRGPFLLPAVAIVDPQLTLSLSPAATATTGLDALTQLLEAFVSVRANPLTDALCRDGLFRIRTALLQAFQDGTNRWAREQMSYASLLSGLALANAGLGVVHGFAAPLGGLLNASHGSICAAVLAAGTAANIQALQLRDPESPSLAKYDEAARILTNNSNAKRDDLLEWLPRLTGALQIRGLQTLGLQLSQLGELVEKAAGANSMKANPIQLTRTELFSVAEHSL